MPIYEYESIDISEACQKCKTPFEYFQGVNDASLDRCPECGKPVRKIISWCRAAVMEDSDEHAHIAGKISAYEKEGKWSHAAELADTHAEKIRDNQLKMRAIDNYQKAGYDANTLEKHARGELTPATDSSF